jgi:hypothetical protein
MKALRMFRRLWLAEESYGVDIWMIIFDIKSRIDIKGNFNKEAQFLARATYGNVFMRVKINCGTSMKSGERCFN